MKEPGQSFTRLPAFIFHTNPYKKDTEGTPWIDVVQPDVGYALFHGDNRKITRSPLEGRGNQRFAEVQHFYFDPPILIFTQKQILGSRKGYREFSGYGIPVRSIINTQREKKSNRYFTNLTIELALFHLAKENELFDWAWIDARRNGGLDAGEVLKLAPDAWKDWVRHGHSVVDRCRRNIARYSIVRRGEQAALTASEMK